MMRFRNIKILFTQMEIIEIYQMTIKLLIIYQIWMMSFDKGKMYDGKSYENDVFDIYGNALSKLFD